MGNFSSITQALTSNRIVSIAHRGASGYAPENTLPAFALAISQGVDILELDVKLTKDGQAVVIHDDRIDRTSNGTGLVSQMTYAELQGLDFGGWFSAAYSPLSIPTLAQVLELAKGRCLLDIELKLDEDFHFPDNDFFATLGVEVLSIVDQCGMRDQVLLSSFSFAILASVKKHHPDIICGYAIAPKDLRKQAAMAARSGMEVIFPQVHSGNQEYISIAHSLGLQVYICVFDVNKIMVAELIAAGVDGIMGDQPDKICRVVDTILMEQER